ncbi:hypothetical protein ABK040_000111 [Willaertia magna]
MNKKLSEERERIARVLDEHLYHIKLLQYLPLYVTQISTELFSLYPQQAQKLITELFEHERTLELKIKENADHKVIEEISTKVKKTLMQICKILKQYNFSVEQASPLKNDDKLEKFVNIMKDMVVIYTDKLHTTKEEEQSMNDQKNEKAAREKKANADLKALQRELATIKGSKEREVSIREDTIKKLDQDLIELKQSTQIQREEFNNQMTERENTSQLKYKKFESMLEEQIRQCENLLTELKVSHHKEEGNKKLNRLTAEQQVYDFVTKYDNFMSEHTYKYNQLVFDYNKDDAKVQFLEKAIAEIEEEKKKRNEEREKKEREKEKLLRQRVHMRYQRLWRRAYKLIFLTNYDNILEKVAKAKESKNPKKTDEKTTKTKQSTTKKTETKRR